MYAIAINGSPRKGGNTELLLTTVLGELTTAGWDTELVQVGGRNVRGCMACYKCFANKDRQCAVTKDMFNEVAEKVYKADAVIMGSPTYFTDVSAELKAVIDRLGLVSIANGGLLKGRIGAAVIAVRRGGATHAFDSINHMYLMSQMLVPGSTYWNMAYGLNPGDVAKDLEGMNNMKNLGRTIAWLGALTASHRDSYPVMLGRDEA